MLFKSWLVAGFAALTVARQTSISRRSEAIAQALQNLPTTKTSLNVLKTDLQGLNKLINALTPSNAATQLEAINKYLIKMNADAEATTKKLSTSGEIGIGDLLGFLNEKTRNEWIALATDIFTAANGTLTGIISKRDIVVKSGKADSIAEGLKLQTKTVLVIYQSSLTQIPGIVKSAVGLAPEAKAKSGKSGKGGTTAPAKAAATPIINLKDPTIVETMGKVLDNVLEQTLNYLKGKQDTVTIPTDLLPSGLADFKLPPMPSGGFPMPTATPEAKPAAKAKTTTAKGKGKSKSFVINQPADASSEMTSPPIS
jgi:hypothetical protein